ncbi:hypothetical protein ACMWKD_24100, partial [Escherichia coli]|uniref:hypothetical protein n=1 Tax=Escherichia coli TaxID=562 RepID=UPI0039E053ED
QKQKKLIMLPSETMIWQPEFTDKTLSRKPGAVQARCRRYCRTSCWMNWIKNWSDVDTASAATQTTATSM